MKFNVLLGGKGSDVYVERNSLKRAGELLDLKRKVLVITDRGVPVEYANTVCAACDQPVRVTVEPGESSKSLETYEKLCKIMLDNGFTRADCVVAVGGGAVVELAGFVAATYMRGIAFYSVPTTLFSQVESSLGGRSSINLGGVADALGCVYQPRAVLIDPNTLKTLNGRQMSNGYAEIIKMAVNFDEQLFELMESEDLSSDEMLDEIICRSIAVKKRIVEADEREAGIGRVLEFGHTVARGIEAAWGSTMLCRGESLAIGMIPMCAPDIRGRVRGVLGKTGLPVAWRYNTEKLCEAVLGCKKPDGGRIALVFCDKIGSYRVDKISVEEFKAMLRSAYGE